MKMEWFELASRSVVVLDQVNSFREESALQWGPVVGTTLRVVSSEAMASLEQQTPNAEEQSAVLPDEDRDPVYEGVYDLEKFSAFSSNTARTAKITGFDECSRYINGEKTSWW